jgi:hypothetical protein
MTPESPKDTGKTHETPRESLTPMVPAKLLPPLGNLQQVRGTRPLTKMITAPRRIFLPLLILKTPAPATWVSIYIKPNGRNLWFRPSLKKQLKHQLPP